MIITLSSPSNASLGSDKVHTYTITDDDDQPEVEVLILTTSSGSESISSTAITVNLSAASSSDITVNYAVSGTAIGSGTDYTLANGTLNYKCWMKQVEPSQLLVLLMTCHQKVMKQ